MKSDVVPNICNWGAGRVEGYIRSEGDAQRGGAAVLAARTRSEGGAAVLAGFQTSSSREVHLFDDMVQTWYEIGWYSFCTSDLFVLFTTGTGRVSTVEKKKWKRRDLR